MLQSKKIRLDLLVKLTKGELLGIGEFEIDGVASVINSEKAKGKILFITSKATLRKTEFNNNCAYIISPTLLEQVKSTQIKQGIIHPNPTQAYRIIAKELKHNYLPKQKNSEIKQSAFISRTARIGENVFIGHNVVIDDKVTIGNNCFINDNSVVKENVIIRQETIIDSNVTIYANTQIGANCKIMSGCVIGSAGFGYSPEATGWEHIPQLGKVILEDKVRIGANVCIDRGALGDTIIKAGVIIDNLVHIAHNVQVGENTALAGCVGIAGSAKIGKNCMFGGQVGIAGHIEICDNVMLNGGSNFLKSVKEPGFYSGVLPSLPQRRWNRLSAYFQRIDALFKKSK